MIPEESYGWKETRNGYEVVLIRAGKINPELNRGGVWFSIMKYKEYVSPYTRNFYSGVGGREEYMTKTLLRKPYFIEVTNRLEGEYPLIMYRDLFGEIPSKRGLYGSKAENKYARIERKCSELLRDKGYDSVVFYYKIGVHAVADQVFLLKDTEAYTKAMKNLTPVSHRYV